METIQDDSKTLILNGLHLENESLVEPPLADLDDTVFCNATLDDSKTLILKGLHLENESLVEPPLADLDSYDRRSIKVVYSISGSYKAIFSSRSYLILLEDLVKLHPCIIGFDLAIKEAVTTRDIVKFVGDCTSMFGESCIISMSVSASKLKLPNSFYSKLQQLLKNKITWIDSNDLLPDEGVQIFPHVIISHPKSSSSSNPTSSGSLVHGERPSSSPSSPSSPSSVGFLGDDGYSDRRNPKNLMGSTSPAIIPPSKLRETLGHISSSRTVALVPMIATASISMREDAERALHELIEKHSTTPQSIVSILETVRGLTETYLSLVNLNVPPPEKCIIS